MPAGREKYITQACLACKTAKRRCMPSAGSTSTRCKRCLELDLTCLVHVRVDGRLRRPRRSKASETPNATSSVASAERPGTYNYVLREMSGVVPTLSAGPNGVHETQSTTPALLDELDTLLRQSDVDKLSRWAEWELGSLHPLLPSARALQQQRRDKAKSGNRRSTFHPALTVMEVTQYLFAVRHTTLLAEDRQDDSIPVAATIEQRLCVILRRCASDLLLSAAPCVEACLALQLLCLINFNPNGKHEPPFALLSAASRMARMAKEGCEAGATDSDTQALVLWCSAYAWELSWALGTAEGQVVYKAESYVDVAPSVQDVQQVRERVLAAADGVGTVGLTRVYDSARSKQTRKEALLASLDRAMLIAIKAQAWIDVQLSSADLRKEREKEDAQLRCLSRVGRVMSTWQRGMDELQERLDACKARLPKCVTELYDVETRLSNTILLGQVMRSQLDAAFDIHSIDRFAVLGERVPLRKFVSVILSSSAQVRGAVDKTQLQSAKALLAELVGQLPDNRHQDMDERGEVAHRWPSWSASDQVLRNHDFPPLLSLGYLFEAGMLVLEAHAPHLSLSRSTLALEDSWALLAWAIHGLISSLLTIDDSGDRSPHPSDDANQDSVSGNQALVVEQHCLHVEARMVLDLPFPLRSDRGDAQWNCT